MAGSASFVSATAVGVTFCSVLMEVADNISELVSIRAVESNVYF